MKQPKEQKGLERLPDNRDIRSKKLMSKELQDVAWVANNPYGIRFLAWECQRLGLGTIPDPDELETYGMAWRLLRRVNEVNPEAAMIILAVCFQIPWSNDLLNQIFHADEQPK